MSFIARSFIFDGIPSEEFNLVVANVGGKSQSPGTVGSKLDIQEDRIPRRARGIHYGTVGNDPLSFPIVFSIAKDFSYFDRYDIARIAKWLTNHQQYKKLIICQDDTESVYYNCIITELTQIEAGGKTIGFEAIVTCDTPFAYRVVPDTFIQCSGDLSVVYRCLSNTNDYYRPDMVIETESSDLTIENKTDGTVFSLSGMTNGKKVITICGETLVMESSNGDNLYDCWNIDMPKRVFRALGGENLLSITGACTIKIKNEFPWSIGH